MLALLREWITNLKQYQKVDSVHPASSSQNDWRSYMESNTAPATSNKWFHFLIAPLFKYRTILVLLLLISVIPLYMLASTYMLFVPDIKWECLNERHNGYSTICDSYFKKVLKQHAICSMELGVDFIWNFTFTQTPVLEFNSYCPLQVTVEPKIVNFLGSLCGSLVGGIFIDTLGRKNMSLSCSFFCILCTFSYYFSSNMIMYTYQEFIKGLFSSIATMSLLTWCVELSIPRYSSLTVAGFFIVRELGELLTTWITYLVMEWRTVFIIISAVGLGVLPLILAMPPSLRYMIAKGKTKKLPSCINFRGGVIVGSRAKDCLSRPATNRLYITNALLLIFLGFSSHLLMEVIFKQHNNLDIFQRAALVQTIMLGGYVTALVMVLLPNMLMYILNIFTVLVAGILAIVATSTNHSDSPWSIARVFTGSSLLLIGLSVSLTFTTMKQIPTLNRGFYASGLNASFMLGTLIYVVLQSWCLERNNEDGSFCSSSSEDIRLITAGVVLLSSVCFVFVNTCLTRNVHLPHSYLELKRLTAGSSPAGPSGKEGNGAGPAGPEEQGLGNGGASRTESDPTAV